MIATMSLLWTVSAAGTVGRALTYAQLLGLVWLVWEFARSIEEQESLMMAYCLGAYVSIVDLVRRFVFGESMIEMRFTGANLDPNDLGVTLAIGIPIAWHLFLKRRGISRVVAAVYVPLASLSILLTASRGAFIAALAALSIIPLTLRWRSFSSMVRTAGILVAAVALAAVIVPASSWDRISSLPREALGGTVGGRLGIWRAGLEAFQQRPMLGAGAGAFDVAIEPFLGRMASHNVFVAVLVEQGLVGIVVFGVLLATCAWCIYRLPLHERRVFAVIALTWFVGGMSLSWQYRKTTWLIFGLLSAQAAGTRIRGEAGTAGAGSRL
jgi:O-antigen ligase